MVLIACSATTTASPDDTPALARAIVALDPDIDPDEARRAAQISYAHARDLAISYEITDPPLVHNTKVNMGLKPRGLCWHWAEDMEKRLLAENFRTLDIRRAISNADNPLRIDHSTALITARGQPMQSGIVLDPWRNGGRLFWSKIKEDKRYDWHPQQEVLAEKYRLTPVRE
ncbi:hypothetical protein QO231_23605 [Sedimentitalea todarodis]|uniref:Lipoprotein n=1 Tax=Sedimentitalea todarodis TaxID=1631240 RepID=A0ABU3VKY9_9RHOB|nr:hypothetical protein [Sedimentitalea todarodis]MDU9006825.1 hypothetical protein [Sedimentitalea todarodis]